MQEAAEFPDWGKMQFYEYPAKPWSELLPKASQSARDLVSKLVQYESGRRMSASEVRLDCLHRIAPALTETQALAHPYLTDRPSMQS